MAIKKVSYPELRIGAEGDLVEMLQDFLQKTGSTTKINGKYSIGTVSAVKKFQKNNGLKITGVCDKATWDALIKAAKKTKKK